MRPVVQVSVGDAIDVRRLAGVNAADELDEERIRQLTDQVMAELVARVAELRGEPAPYPLGVPESALPGASQLGRQTTTD